MPRPLLQMTGRVKGRCACCLTPTGDERLDDCEVCGRYVCGMCFEYYPACKECHEQLENQPDNRFEAIIEDM